MAAFENEIFPETYIALLVMLPVPQYTAWPAVEVQLRFPLTVHVPAAVVLLTFSKLKAADPVEEILKSDAVLKKTLPHDALSIISICPVPDRVRAVPDPLKFATGFPKLLPPTKVPAAIVAGPATLKVSA